MDIYGFWDAILRQDATAIRSFFHPDAWVNWHNTNEHFTAEASIRANCAYPGQWEGTLERDITTQSHIIRQPMCEAKAVRSPAMLSPFFT